jgi:hypothetical protein
MTAVADTVIGRWFTPAFVTRRPDQVAGIKSLLLAAPAEGYAATCEALAAMDLRDDLARITASTLVIAGAEDQATPPEHAEEIARRIRGAELVVLPDAAHLANIEQPDAVTHRILGHLKAPAPYMGQPPDDLDSDFQSRPDAVRCNGRDAESKRQSEAGAITERKAVRPGGAVQPGDHDGVIGAERRHHQFAAQESSTSQVVTDVLRILADLRELAQDLRQVYGADR